MISREKWNFLTPLQKLPKNVGKIIVATGFEKLPKVQYIVQSGHTYLRLPGIREEAVGIKTWNFTENCVFGW